MTALPPPGWFPDPDAGGSRWRWWDGARWAPPAYGYAPAYDPAAHARELAKRAESAHRSSRWFRGVIAAQAGIMCLYAFVVAIVYHGGPPDIAADGPDATAQFLRVFFALGPLIALVNLVTWAYFGLFVWWLYDAGKFADLQPWPAARSRALGAFSPLIPILNFWWPYEAIRDCYPPGGRPPVALRWFVAQLVIPWPALIAVIVTTSYASVGFTAVAVVLAGVLFAGLVMLGWKLVDHLDAMQQGVLNAV